MLGICYRSRLRRAAKSVVAGRNAQLCLQSSPLTDPRSAPVNRISLHEPLHDRRGGLGGLVESAAGGGRSHVQGGAGMQPALPETRLLPALGGRAEAGNHRVLLPAARRRTHTSTRAHRRCRGPARPQLPQVQPDCPARPSPRPGRRPARTKGGSILAASVNAWKSAATSSASRGRFGAGSLGAVPARL